MVGNVILAALLTAGLVAAQRGGGSGGMGGGRSEGPSMGMPRPQSQGTLELIAEKLKLSKEQKEQVADIFKARSEAASPLAQQILNGRKAIVQAMVNGADSGADFDKLTNDYTAVVAKLDGVDADAYAKIYTLLKPNQQKNAEPVFVELMAAMSGGSGGGGRRRE